MKRSVKTILALLLAAMLAVAPALAEGAQPGYTLERVVVLSRHNIRSPLSGSGSMLYEITPHEWFEWTSKSSELSLRGAMLETLMGQYFRLWLEDEGLFPERSSARWPRPATSPPDCCPWRSCPLRATRNTTRWTRPLILR